MEKLEVSTSEKSFIVTWDKPKQHKTSYSYNLTVQTSDGSIIYYYKTKQQPHRIKDLVPGSRYTVNVITETSDGTQSDSTSISDCTSMVITAA